MRSLIPKKRARRKAPKSTKAEILVPDGRSFQEYLKATLPKVSDAPKPRGEDLADEKLPDTIYVPDEKATLPIVSDAPNPTERELSDEELPLIMFVPEEDDSEEYKALYRRFAEKVRLEREAETKACVSSAPTTTAAMDTSSRTAPITRATRPPTRAGSSRASCPRATWRSSAEPARRAKPASPPPSRWPSPKENPSSACRSRAAPCYGAPTRKASESASKSSSNGPATRPTCSSLTNAS